MSSKSRYLMMGSMLVTVLAAGPSFGQGEAGAG